MKFDTYDYTVAEHWFSAIINGDYSGLEDDEVETLDAWLEANQERASHWDMGDSVGFSQCEITGLMSECYTLTQNVPLRG